VQHIPAYPVINGGEKQEKAAQHNDRGSVRDDTGERNASTDQRANGGRI
jgi:hypothetical protein